MCLKEGSINIFFKINRFIKNYHMINFPRGILTSVDACKS